MLQDSLRKELGSVTFNQLAPGFNPHEIEDSLIEKLMVGKVLFSITKRQD
ncbi:hypothetical protein GCM10011514_49270 [Emticicia aquatilis]|uniref:Uncharacterized protein n=1 Tax=Emticicia aquatilis TaxID=1537369 RepID=A0A916Z721_9BACT|nr:hypothetical protein GCM10011514_49270 [Emticicia aquatilis]